VEGNIFQYHKELVIRFATILAGTLSGVAVAIVLNKHKSKWFWIVQAVSEVRLKRFCY
jgi:hypothetical protein